MIGPVISPAMVEEYERNGVICVRNVIDMERVERLREAVSRVLSGPTGMDADAAVEEGRPADPNSGIAKFRQAMNGWQQDDEYRALLMESAVPKVAAELMRSATARVLYDQTLVKEPGSPVPVSWHHDQPFWPVSGDQVCSVWVALDEVTPDSAPVHYARGSHLRSERYRPTVPSGPPFDSLVNCDLPTAPDLFQVPEADLVTWDMMPGDVLVFTGKTLHGSGANLRKDRPRRAIAARYVGDDARFIEGMHVLSLAFPEQPALKTGEPLSGDLFPLAWHNEELKVS